MYTVPSFQPKINSLPKKRFSILKKKTQSLKFKYFWYQLKISTVSNFELLKKGLQGYIFTIKITFSYLSNKTAFMILNSKTE